MDGKWTNLHPIGFQGDHSSVKEPFSPGREARLPNEGDRNRNWRPRELLWRTISGNASAGTDGGLRLLR